jgi:hypothetical protein
MGACCAMESAVPDDILPDPSGPSEFWVQSVSMMSSDYDVHADKDHTQKWLIIDKQGGLFDDHCRFVVENFVRPDGGKIGSGHCLSSCDLDPLGSDNYKYYDMDWDRDIIFEDSDDSDGYSTDGSSDDEVGQVIKQKCKWRCKTKAKFFEDREHTKKIAECKVKAKGKAKKKVVQVEVEYKDSEGHRKTRTDTQTREEKKVKKFFYKLTIGDSDNEIPVILHGSFNKSSGSLKWECPGFFDSEIEGFWTAKPHIKTHSEQYPAMDLLLAFMISNILAPEDIKNHCSPPFR